MSEHPTKIVFTDEPMTPAQLARGLARAWWAAKKDRLRLRVQRWLWEQTRER